MDVMELIAKELAARYNATYIKILSVNHQYASYNNDYPFYYNVKSKVNCYEFWFGYSNDMFRMGSETCHLANCVLSMSDPDILKQITDKLDIYFNDRICVD